MKRTLLLLSTYLILLGQILLLQAETLHTTSTGGDWNNPTTWEENRLPTAADNVEINGTVSVNTTTTIAGLTVNPGAILQPSSSRTLTITGDLINNGTLQNSNYYLYLEISGNIINNGIWTNHTTHLTGTQPRSIELISPISTIVQIQNSFTITNGLTFTNTIHLNNNTLSFAQDATATFEGEVQGNGTIEASHLIFKDHVSSLTLVADNTDFISTDSTQDISLNSASLPGEVVFGGTNTKNIRSNFTINGSMTVASGVTLQPSYGSRTLTINGEIINQGTIQNTYYSLYLHATDNVTNDGTWANQMTYLTGTKARTITGHPIAGTIQFNDNLVIKNSQVFSHTVYLNGKTITFEPGETATFESELHGGGTLEADTLIFKDHVSSSPILMANDIHFVGTNDKQDLTLSTEPLTSTVVFGGFGAKNLRQNMTINGSMTVASGVTLQPSYGSRTLTINGEIINQGTIQNTSYSLYLYSLYLYTTGNLTNHGNWTNYKTYATWNDVTNANPYEFNLTGEPLARSALDHQHQL